MRSFDDANDFAPIDVVEIVATNKNWEYDRVAEDQIAMAIEGQWRTYSLTLATQPTPDKSTILRTLATFDCSIDDAEKLNRLYHVLNLINDKLWGYNMTYWKEQELIVFRGALDIPDGTMPGEEKIEQIISYLVNACELYYPAIQLAVWGDKPVEEALMLAIDTSYNRSKGMRPQ